MSTERWRSWRRPPAAGVRRVVLGLVVAGGAVEFAALASPWWVTRRPSQGGPENSQVSHGRDDGSVFLTVALTVALLVAVERTMHGRRSFVTPTIVLLGPVLAYAWYASTGETIDSDASGEPRFGLYLGTVTVALGLTAAAVGLVGRSAAARTARRRSPQSPGPARVGLGEDE